MEEDSLSADGASQEDQMPKKRTLNSMYLDLKKPVVAEAEDLLLEAEEQEAELSADDDEGSGDAERSDMDADSDDLNAADMKDVQNNILSAI